MVLEVFIDRLEAFSEKFWRVAGSSKVFLFHGEMGAGKTTLIAALCKYKGVREAVSSPTFSIINEYVYEEQGLEKKIFHLDLYRLNSIEEIIGAGVEDCIYSDQICFVEWPQKSPLLFDKNSVKVFVSIINDRLREVKVETNDA
jgi:tRNA threonylcarbamoyladenosine biosynthesis protein TsaE